ncbi:hypothetical protein [Alkalicoccobacillus porphyridii]|uniref:Uncharacterized protein n=1 Tax=Alkalicoccobacillus porphyridii TaxID=2597270 RepID=A0A554A1C8_9BACI|nr:hypothetical protein [Alkalicoccobacillus porphyridii]TSB47489.1 hypothetical protein FN960_07065 [Alkalicoccobacillus porphyridii]
MSSFSMIKKDQQFLVCNSDGVVLAEIHKLHAAPYEKGHAFIYKSKDNASAIHLGIKKGRLLFAQYLLQIESESYTLQDHKAKTLLYFAVSGKINGKQIDVEENWNEHIDLRVAGEKVAILKPYAIRSGANIDIVHEAKNELYLSILALFYFMYQIYKEETAFVEDLIEEALEF